MDVPKKFTKPINAIQPGTQLVAEHFLGYGFTCEDEAFLHPEKNIKVFSQGVQTELREEDAQTSPWDPPFFSCPGRESELLFLKNFQYGADLPAGTAQVDIIDMYRARRQWEETFLDPERKDKQRYYTALGVREKEKFSRREGELRDMHKKYLNSFTADLAKRHCYLERLNRIRLDYQWAIKLEEKQIQQDKMAVKAKNEFHYLEHRRKKLYPLKKKRDIIQEYSDYSSPVYEPPAILGNRPNHISRFKDFSKSQYLTTYEGLLEIEPYLLEVGKYDWAPKERRSLAETRYFKFLKSIQRDIRFHKMSSLKESSIKKKDLLAERVRPYTPTLPAVEIDTANKEVARFILQRLIRGRGIQYQTLVDRSINKDLIDELHRVQYVCEAEREMINDRKLEIVQAKAKQKINEKLDRISNEFMDELAATTFMEIIVYLAEVQLKNLDNYREKKKAEEAMKEFMSSKEILALKEPEVVDPKIAKQQEAQRRIEEARKKRMEESEKKRLEKEALKLSRMEKSNKEKEDKKLEAPPSITGIVTFLSPEQLEMIEVHRDKTLCDTTKKRFKKKYRPKK